MLNKTSLMIYVADAGAKHHFAIYAVHRGRAVRVRGGTKMIWLKELEKSLTERLCVLWHRKNVSCKSRQ